MEKILLTLYNIGYLIIMVMLVPIAVFNSNLRNPFFKRFFVQRKLRKWKKINSKYKIISIHCSSYGEYEHIIPFIKSIKKNNKNIKICLQFFSPSGYLFVKKNKDVDLITYSPFDIILFQYIFFKTMNPIAHIYAKYDVWPSEIYSLKMLKIKTLLINASLSENSNRFKRFRKFHKKIYEKFNFIYTVSEEDKSRFNNYFNIDKNLFVIGDTKNDQVLSRRESSSKKPIFPNIKNENDLILICGSIWEEDWDILKSFIQQMLQRNKKFKVILCPHQIKNSFIEHIENYLSNFEIKLFSQIDEKKLTTFPKVLIIDVIGKLAELYKYGNIAFVGGSFKEKVHNVLEPAIFGIPVVTGPFIKNSSEALELKNSGLIVINNEKDLFNKLETLVQSKEELKKIGNLAQEYVNKKLGVSEKLYVEINKKVIQEIDGK